MRILVSESDKIPTKKVVSVVCNVSAKKVMWFSDNPDKCMEELKKKAEEVGANAIINFAYEPAGALGISGSCRGLAVKVVDIDEEEERK